MNIAHTLARRLSTPAPPPPGGFRDDLPEAFAALNEDGGVMVIGYQGEWYEPIRPSLLTRLHNWLVAVGNRRIEAGECRCWVGHGDCGGCSGYPGIRHEPACGWEQNPDCPQHGAPRRRISVGQVVLFLRGEWP